MSQIKIYSGFPEAISELTERVRARSTVIHTEKWQGMEIKSRPEAEMRELLFPAFQVLIPTTDLKILAEQIQPNLPWADQHFETERVCGQPLNPGETWKTWPWGNSADKFRSEGEQFSHSYAERYWPKYAGVTEKGVLPPTLGDLVPHQGTRYAYGDLQDVLNLLIAQPFTRQAYIPIFFPEDTGAIHGGRIPCSTGYHLILRGGALHIVYQLRSCDFFRHFRDDVYLTVRLLLWFLERLQNKSPEWETVRPGVFTMLISSLHLFTNDYRTLFGPSGVYFQK